MSTRSTAKKGSRVDLEPAEFGIAAARRSQVLESLAAYDAALDLPIVRVLADADATSLRAVIEAAAP